MDFFYFCAYNNHPMQMIRKEIKSFGHAFRGIGAALASETHLKIHVAILLLVVAFGIWLQISITEWLICLICFGGVISAELFNTAIESIVDLVSPEIHPLAGRAKDVAAGAVLVSAIFTAIVGLFIFIPKLYILVMKMII